MNLDSLRDWTSPIGVNNMEQNKSSNPLKIAVAVSFLVMLAANALANILPFNGLTTGEISDRFPNLFAPAGITFSIWGLIYLTLAVYTIYQFIWPKDPLQRVFGQAGSPADTPPAAPVSGPDLNRATLGADDGTPGRSNAGQGQVQAMASTAGTPSSSAPQPSAGSAKPEAFQKMADLAQALEIAKRQTQWADWIRVWFILSSVANTAWIFAWHYQGFGLSVILIVTILISLIAINLATHRQTNRLMPQTPMTLSEKIFVRLPFSLYFGWITVATIANITTYLVSVNWDRFGLSEPFWTIAILLAGVLIGGVTVLVNRDYVYGLVLIWAYAGILIKHTSATGFAWKYMLIIIALAICIALLVASEIMAIYYTGKRAAKREAQQKETA
jgi:hypothetical protein